MKGAAPAGAGASSRRDEGWLAERARLQALAVAIEPSVRLQTKDGWHWRVLAVLAACATGGGISRRRFLEDFATTLGPLQGYPRAWSVERVELTLVHEARHTRQARWCGLGLHPWLGLPVFAALYLLPVLPLGFAPLRLWFELDADRVLWRFLLERGADADEVRQRARRFAHTVCSGAYGWSLPPRWGVPLFERAAERLLGDVLHSTSPGGLVE